MKKILFLSLMTAIVCVSSIALVACDDDDKDMTPPTISGENIVASPINCQVYHPGDTIYFHYLFTDDVELGSYNIEVHGNFDHHSHSTEGDSHEEVECEADHHHEEGEEEGTAWVFNQGYTIPSGLSSYDANLEIPVPTDAKHGDYHFMIRLLDKAGSQQIKAIAIIIEE